MAVAGGASPVLARDLVGRDGEIDGLRDAWRAGGSVRIVRGPAGIGKSRLVRELGAWAVAHGGVVLVGRATPRAAPLRPLREALLGAARLGVRPGVDVAPFVPTLSALVPEWSESTVTTPESGPVLGEAVLRLLVSLAGAGTATLIVEDLQWADLETLAVVEYLADNVAGQPVLLVATLRDGAPGDGRVLAHSLVGRRVASDVILGPLGRDAVAAVAHSCLTGRELPTAALDALVSRSEGIPLLVEELLFTAIDTGWTTIANALPGSVLTSVELRLEALPESGRRLLMAAALLGRSFDWTIATRVAELDELAAAEQFRRSVRAQLLDVDGPSFRFRHALMRDAVLTVTTPAEVELLARRALTAMDLSAPHVDGDRLLLGAELAGRAGRRELAASFLLRAARLVLGQGALASAELFATRAGELATDELADDVDDVLLEINVLAGHTERAAALGARLLERRHEPAALAAVHLLVGNADLAAGHWHRAEHHAEAAATLAPDAAQRARADALAAHVAMARDDVDVAVARAREALHGARESGLADVQCEALEVLGRAERGRDPMVAEAAFQEAHDIAAATGLALWRVRALQELGTIDLFVTLDLHRLEEARQEAVALGALATVAVVDLQLSAVHEGRGEFDLSLAAALRCEDASRRLRLSTLPMSLALQGMVHSRRADRAELERVVAAALATGEDSDYVDMMVWGNDIPVFHLVTGDPSAAAAALDRGMEVLRRRPAAVVPFPGMWALVRTLLDDGGEAARHEVARLTFDTPVSRQMLVAAEAVALGRAGHPDDAAARFAVADKGLFRSGFGFRRPLVRMLVAPDAHRDGWGESAAWLRESLAAFEATGLDVLASRCRRVLRDVGAPVPRRTRAAVATAVPPALAELAITAREVDVLVLVAGGATNREVAERLFISPRTVDKHVERLLQKTGTSRRGLVDIARGAGLLST